METNVIEILDDDEKQIKPQPEYQIKKKTYKTKVMKNLPVYTSNELPSVRQTK